MPTYTREILSASTNGRPIPVAATATPGTLIHTPSVGTSDEVYLWAANVTGSAATLTIEWGGVTDPGDHLVKSLSIAANSAALLIADGNVIQGGLSVRAFSGTGSAINITGHVLRVT